MVLIISQKRKNIKKNIKYIIENKRIHKSIFKKSITGISESKLNLIKIWDCGKIKFERLINKKL
jgi:hypothetical protein